MTEQAKPADPNSGDPMMSRGAEGDSAPPGTKCRKCHGEVAPAVGELCHPCADAFIHGADAR